MNPMHQLTRRPVKAAFGALLLALAGVILALSGGQFWAASFRNSLASYVGPISSYTMSPLDTSCRFPPVTTATVV